MRLKHRIVGWTSGQGDLGPHVNCQTWKPHFKLYYVLPFRFAEIFLPHVRMVCIFALQPSRDFKCNRSALDLEGKKGCRALLMHIDIILDIILSLQEVVQIAGGWSEDLFAWILPLSCLFLWWNCTGSVSGTRKREIHAWLDISYPGVDSSRLAYEGFWEAKVLSKTLWNECTCRNVSLANSKSQICILF